jgi:site-specific DNA-methyltransferase (adenine-specific)
MLKIDEETYFKMPIELQRLFYQTQNHLKEEVVEGFPNVNGGTAIKENSCGKNIFTDKDKPTSENIGYGDSGSASRFFYCAKASQAERNMGLMGAKSTHPTVKPLELMRYLVRLITPKGGVCLDPYVGSGTTAIACKKEKFDYIGIELDEKYHAIAEARIKAAIVEYDIFDYL